MVLGDELQFLLGTMEGGRTVERLDERGLHMGHKAWQLGALRKNLRSTAHTLKQPLGCDTPYAWDVL
jgi:hypothetical protein